jgi:hypothetical protein
MWIDSQVCECEGWHVTAADLLPPMLPPPCRPALSAEDKRRLLVEAAFQLLAAGTSGNECMTGCVGLLAVRQLT